MDLCTLRFVFSSQCFLVAAFLPEGFSNLGSTKLHRGITLDLKVAKSKLDSWKKFRCGSANPDAWDERYIYLHEMVDFLWYMKVINMPVPWDPMGEEIRFCFSG